MEVIWICIMVFVAAICTYLLWKNHCLKRDIYGFTDKLDESLNKVLDEVKLEEPSYTQDDLWEKVYAKLCRISDMYFLKNHEIYEEKENLKELISDISHQIKTPLSNIKLYQEMLHNEMDKRELKCCLNKMNGQVDKLDFLIQNIVKLSRLETGTIKIQKSEISLMETLAAAIEAVIPNADSKNIEIHVDCDETLCVSHDKKWTAEALFNILDNAVKYSGEGGNIRISVKKEEIFTKISITDTGKGIPLERQGMIFTRFYREPEVHDSEGVGIGLYLARKIVSMQDGYIEVESEVGTGSTFHINLPG